MKFTVAWAVWCVLASAWAFLAEARSQMHDTPSLVNMSHDLTRNVWFTLGTAGFVVGGLALDRLLIPALGAPLVFLYGSLALRQAHLLLRSKGTT